MSNSKINKYLQTYKRKPNNLDNIRLLVEEYKKVNDIENVIRFQKKRAKLTPAIDERGVTLNEIGVLYFNLEQFSSAIKYFNKVLEIKELYEVLNNITNCYGRLHQFSTAKQYALRSLEIKNHFVAHKQLANLFFYEKEYVKSIEHYHESLRLNNQQDNIDSTYNICFPYLANKEFEAGLKYYENRLIQPKSEGPLHDRLALPTVKLWKTQSDFKHLLVVAEQGLGDMVMFFRFVLQLADTYPDQQIHFFCKKELAHLFTHDKPNLTIIQGASDLSLYDYKVYLMSLPYHLKTKHIAPIEKSYIQVKPDTNDYWKRKLSHSKRLKVGIVWKGLLSSWIEKDIPMKALKPLAELDIDLICLHRKSEYQDDLNSIDFSNRFKVYDIDKDIPFDDTVAIINNLDLLITVDTVTVHLAGNMNTPTWLLLGKYTDWRWFDDNTPVWYDNVELIRNSRRDDWETAIIEAAQRLHHEFNVPYTQTHDPSTPLVAISIGELFDKYTILTIKQEKITNQDKVDQVTNELNLLTPLIQQYDIEPTIVDELRQINLALWEIEDQIRIKEANKEFDEQFIELARNVYITNDQRARIKHHINMQLKSNIVEVKDYNEY